MLQDLAVSGHSIKSVRAASTVSKTALDKLFLGARTHHAFTDAPVSKALLREVYEILRMGPTSYNTCPARFVFVTSKKAKTRLLTCLDRGNMAQTEQAPVTAIVAYDMDFYEKLGKLAPESKSARQTYAGHDELIRETAFRNGTLQGAYLILAARAMGLDCGPMSGFDNAKVDQLFFAGTSWKSNFLCNIGHGDSRKLKPRQPRLRFDEACKFL